VEAARQVFAVLETLEQAFQECSKGKAFFGGDSAGLVDVMLGGHLGWLYATEAICGVKVVDAAAGGVGGAFLRAGCCQGADPGRGEACGV
jgi:glutathione S-transferase